MDRPKPFQWFIDRYVNHVVRGVNSRASKVRDLQATSGRKKERIVRYEIYSADLTLRHVKQDVYRITVRVTGDGRLERLDEDTAPDVIVLMDLPAVWGIAHNRYVQRMPDGSTRVVEPFTVFDALRLGKVEWAGTSSTLQDLLLFERRVGPEFLEALKLPKEPDDGERRRK